MPPVEGIPVISGGAWWSPEYQRKHQLTPDMVEAVQLVQLRNTRWKPGEDPDREYYQKYQVTLKNKRKVLLPNRVSSVSGLKWDITPLMDWQAREVANRALGTPVLTYINEQGQTVQVRGNWRKIDKAQRDYPDATLHLEPGLVGTWEEFSPHELIAKHREAFARRSDGRDEAAELGTRAHQLIDLWFRFHDDQLRNESGLVLIDEVLWRKDGKLMSSALAKEDHRVAGACRAFWNFWTSEELELIATEKLVVDLANGLAGQIDNISRTPSGAKVIVDYKTGNYISESVFLQVSGYADLEEMESGVPVDRAYAVQLNKETAEYRLYPVFTTPEERAEHIGAWKRALELYHWQKATNKELGDLRQQEPA